MNKKVLRIKNLTRNVTKEHLEEIFAFYGKVEKAEVAYDKVRVHACITNWRRLLTG